MIYWINPDVHTNKVGIVYTDDPSLEHVYDCDFLPDFINGLMKHLMKVENTQEQYIEDSIKSEKLRFCENRKISEIEKAHLLKKMNFSNI